MPEAEFRLRRGTALRWDEVNPVLGPGEPGYETDTEKMKIGDGWTPWRDLEYLKTDVADDGSSSAAVAAHIIDETPHPVYDDGPSLELFYENVKV